MAESDVDILEVENRWKAGAIEGLRRFGYIAVPFTLYLLFSTGGFIPASIMDNVHMVLAVALFILGLPLTVILQIDMLGEALGGGSREYLLAIAALVVALNFAMLGAIMGWKKKKRPSE